MGHLHLILLSALAFFLHISAALIRSKLSSILTHLSFLVTFSPCNHTRHSIKSLSHSPCLLHPSCCFSLSTLLPLNDDGFKEREKRKSTCVTSLFYVPLLIFHPPAVGCSQKRHTSIISEFGIWRVSLSVGPLLLLLWRRHLVLVVLVLTTREGTMKEQFELPHQMSWETRMERHINRYE